MKTLAHSLVRHRRKLAAKDPPLPLVVVEWWDDTPSKSLIMRLSDNRIARFPDFAFARAAVLR